MLTPCPAPSGREVQLQRRVATRAEDGLPGGDGERPESEVRVEKDPRGVYDGSRTRGRAGRERGPGLVENRACGVVRAGAENAPPEPVGGLAKGLPGPKAPMAGDEREPPRVRQENLDRRRDARRGCQDP